MKEQDKTEKITFLNVVIRLIQGILLGGYSMVPFSNVRNLRETMGMREDHLNRKASFGAKLLWTLQHRWSYAIGFILGVLLFCFIPLSKLFTNYPNYFSVGLALFCLGSYAFAAYSLSRLLNDDSLNSTTTLIDYSGTKKKDYSSLSSRNSKAIKGDDPLMKVLWVLACIFTLGLAPILKGLKKNGWKNCISVLCCFAAALIIPFMFSLIGLAHFDAVTDFLALIIYFLLFAIGSFLTFFSGVSLATMMYATSTYLLFGDGINSFLTGENKTQFIPLIAVCVLGGLAGYVAQLFMKDSFSDLRKEKHAINMGFYLIGIVICLMNLTIKDDSLFVEVENITETAQLIAFITTILAFLAVGIVTTVHGYPFLNKKDFDEVERL